MAFLAPINLVEEIAKPISLSLRLFGNIFAGGIMNASTISRRLINLATAMLGFIRGGLAMVTVGASIAATWGALSPNCHQTRPVSRPLPVWIRDSCACSALSL